MFLSIHRLVTSSSSLVPAFLPMAMATALVGCGFGAQPKSGTVACKPQGGACCPEGYVCVGRGLSTAGSPSAGTCWSRSELPPDAVVTTHDYTQTVLTDPACLVTDWLPPELVGIGMAPDDAGMPDPGGSSAVPIHVPSSGTSGSSTASCPLDPTVFPFYMSFSESAPWTSASNTTLPSSPSTTIMGLTPGYFSTARMRLSGGFLEAEKTLGASPPVGASAFFAYWSGVGSGTQYIRVLCSPGDAIACGKSGEVSCLGSWQTITITSSDSSLTCGFGRQSGTHRIDWIARK